MDRITIVLDGAEIEVRSTQRLHPGRVFYVNTSLRGA